MYIKQIYTSCLAQASYYIESNQEAIIIDPIRDFSPYIQLLKERKAKLKYIFETHFHADFVSGHIELARLTNAKIVFGPKANTGYDCIIAKDREEFHFGNLCFRVLHTPGHTMESTCYLLLSNNNPEAIFTGDTLFIGEVGRPDLAVNPNVTSEKLAGLLYDSLHNILMHLPDHVTVYPGHGAGSACGKNISRERRSTIGEQKQFNYALQEMTKEQFTAVVLDGILPAPKYFEHDVKMNKNGYDTVTNVLSKSLTQLDSNMITNYIKKGAIVLDVRMPNDFEKGFIPGSINIGQDGMLAPWVGTLIPSSSELIIICYKNDEEQIISRLARVGYENVIGYAHGITQWSADKMPIDTIQSIYPSDIISQADSIILDVRKQNELETGFVEKSTHIPLRNIEDNISKLDESNQYLIYCAGGYRSMIACSILKSKGYKQVINIYGGFTAIAQNMT